MQSTQSDRPANRAILVKQTMVMIDSDEAPPDRATLIMYLRYALDDLAKVNETSAALVRMAIVSLEEETSTVPEPADLPLQ